MPNPAKTSGGYTVDEIAQRRVEAYDRYKERKGPDAKVLHGAGAVAAAAAPLASHRSARSGRGRSTRGGRSAGCTRGRPKRRWRAAAPAAPAEPAAASGVSPFHRLPNPAKTSGGYTADELAQRRQEAYRALQGTQGLRGQRDSLAGGGAQPLQQSRWDN
ncbi:MAG: hypothetical protein V9E94_03325 [Microthrixaceae bacterium]